MCRPGIVQAGERRTRLTGPKVGDSATVTPSSLQCRATSDGKREDGEVGRGRGRHHTSILAPRDLNLETGEITGDETGQGPGEKQQ